MHIYKFSYSTMDMDIILQLVVAYFVSNFAATLTEIRRHRICLTSFDSPTRHPLIDTMISERSHIKAES